MADDLNINVGATGVDKFKKDMSSAKNSTEGLESALTNINGTLSKTQKTASGASSAANTLSKMLSDVKAMSGRLSNDALIKFNPKDVTSQAEKMSNDLARTMKSMGAFDLSTNISLDDSAAISQMDKLYKNLVNIQARAQKEIDANDQQSKTAARNAKAYAQIREQLRQNTTEVKNFNAAIADSSKTLAKFAGINTIKLDVDLSEEELSKARNKLRKVLEDANKLGQTSNLGTSELREVSQAYEQISNQLNKVTRLRENEAKVARASAESTRQSSASMQSYYKAVEAAQNALSQHKNAIKLNVDTKSTLKSLKEAEKIVRDQMKNISNNKAAGLNMVNDSEYSDLLNMFGKIKASKNEALSMKGSALLSGAKSYTKGLKSMLLSGVSSGLVSGLKFGLTAGTKFIGGFVSKFATLMNNVVGPKAFASFGKAGLSAFDKLNRSAAGSMNSITSLIAKPADAVKSMTSNIIGMAAAFFSLRSAAGVMTDAVSRVDTIDAGTKALTTLTGSADTAKGIINGLSNAIEGTPIALDQVIDGAKRFVAAGMDARKVEKVYTSIADAAYGVGKQSESMDPLITAFSQMQSSSTAQLEDIRQLEDQSVPALRILANQANMTADAMKNNLSKGLIDSKWAIDALVDGIHNGTNGVNGMTAAMGGMAKTAGDTLSGARANFKTSMIKLAADMITPFKGDAINVIKTATSEIKKLQAAMNSNADLQNKLAAASSNLSGQLIGLMNGSISANDAFNALANNSKLGSMAKAMAAIVAASSGVKIIAPMFASLSSSIMGVTGSLGIFGSALGGIGAIMASGLGVGALATAIALSLGGLDSVVGGSLDKVIATAGTKAAALIPTISKTIETTLTGFTDVGAKLLGSLSSTFVPMVASLANTLIDSLSSMISTIGKNAGDIFGPISNSLMDVISNLLLKVPELAKAAANIIDALASGITANAPKLTDSFTKGLAGLGAQLPVVAGSLAKTFTAIISGLAANSSSIANTVGSTIGGLIDVIINYGPEFFKSGVTIVAKLIQGIAAQLPKAALAIGVNFVSFAQSVAQNIPSTIDAILKGVMGAITSFTPSIEPIIASIASIVSSIGKALTDNTPTIIEATNGLLEAMIQSMTDHGDEMAGGMVQLITAVITIIGANLPLIGQLGGTIAEALRNGIVNNKDALLQGVMVLVIGLVAGVVELGGRLGMIGLQFAEWIGEGISKGVGFVVAGIESVLDSIGKELQAFISNIGKNIANMWKSVGIGPSILSLFGGSSGGSGGSGGGSSIGTSSKQSAAPSPFMSFMALTPQNNTLQTNMLQSTSAKLAIPSVNRSSYAKYDNIKKAAPVINVNNEIVGDKIKTSVDYLDAVDAAQYAIFN